MTGLLSDTKLIENIKTGGIKRQQAIATIYKDKKLKNQVIAFVTNNNGNREDGIDIFHEGIIAFDDNIRKDKYLHKGNLMGYLFSICRFIWLNKLRKDKRMVYTEEDSQLDQISYDTPESLSLAQEQKDVINKLLSRLGEKCQQILELWKLSYSMEEIASQVGLSNAGNARKQRFTCYQKLLQIVDSEPGLKNALK